MKRLFLIVALLSGCGIDTVDDPPECREGLICLGASQDEVQEILGYPVAVSLTPAELLLSYENDYFLDPARNVFKPCKFGSCTLQFMLDSSEVRRLTWYENLNPDLVGSSK